MSHLFPLSLPLNLNGQKVLFSVVASREMGNWNSHAKSGIFSKVVAELSETDYPFPRTLNAHQAWSLDIIDLDQMPQEISDIVSALYCSVHRRIIAGIMDESAAMRLQHIGLFWVIHFESQLPGNGPITTTSLMNLTGLADTAILAITRKLVTIGLLERTQIHASHGRGRLWAFRSMMPTDLAQKTIRDHFGSRKDDES